MHGFHKRLKRCVFPLAWTVSASCQSPPSNPSVSSSSPLNEQGDGGVRGRGGASNPGGIRGSGRGGSRDDGRGEATRGRGGSRCGRGSPRADDRVDDETVGVEHHHSEESFAVDDNEQFVDEATTNGFPGDTVDGDQTPAPRPVKEGSPIESSDPPAVLELFPIEYVEPHRFEGSFIVKGKEDTLATLNPIPGDSVYGEKRVSFYDRVSGAMVEYRVWNPFRSKLAAGMMAGIENTRIKPGSKVLYLGAAYGVTASHVSDIVGPEGLVYAVEASPRRGQRLAEIAENRPNITPIVADARYPSTYRMRVQVDTIISDIADPHQAQIIAHNAMMLLKTGGYCVTTIMPNRIDRTAAPEAVFAKEIEKLKGEEFNLCERISLEPYERDQVMVVVQYQPSAKP